ncbi:MAG: hypothetical protein NWR72_03115, partial [Bacteroidia bacterium]|nr:hypothetical protein [Bacteroidia bacterium]
MNSSTPLMIMMKYLFILPISILFMVLSAQAQTKSINFQLSLNGQPLEIGKNYFLPSIQDSIQIDAFKMYLSDLTFFRGNEKLGTAKKQHILLDAETPSSLKLGIPAIGGADRVRFQVGIDSVTNMAGAMGG